MRLVGFGGVVGIRMVRKPSGFCLDGLINGTTGWNVHNDVCRPEAPATAIENNTVGMGMKLAASRPDDRLMVVVVAMSKGEMVRGHGE